ncbi:hypothetical protein, partial [Serratia odorifera]|uniref:hypothetical protein n=1 Tax=Serratia odorifera TaxID=618 RepID=UPI0023618BF1
FEESAPRGPGDRESEEARRCAFSFGIKLGFEESLGAPKGLTAKVEKAAKHYRPATMPRPVNRSDYEHLQGL